MSILQSSDGVKKSWAAVVRDGKTAIVPKSIRTTHDTAATKQDGRSRQVVIVGIPYEENEDTWKAVYYKVLTKILAVTTKIQFRAFRVGNRSPEHPTMMMVQFQDGPRHRAVESRRLVMRNIFRLKGSRIWIFPDLTTANHCQVLPIERKELTINLKKDMGSAVSNQKAPGFDQKDVTIWMHLPVRLVELIFARLPFPDILKVKCLSKSWRVRFASIEDIEDDEKKRLASYFQKLVGENSHKWKTFWPTFVYMHRFPDDNVFHSAGVAYDRLSLKWRQLPSLSFLPKDLRPRWQNGVSIHMDGALWFWWKSSTVTWPERVCNSCIVANIFTQSWKLLPPFPGESIVHEKFVVNETSRDYRVIVVCSGDMRSGPFLHIYDSKVELWTSGKIVIPKEFDADEWDEYASMEYLNGVVYTLKHGRFMGYRWIKYLWALDLETRIISAELQLPISKNSVMDWVIDDDYYHGNLAGYFLYDVVVCKGKLMMVVQQSRDRWNKKAIIGTVTTCNLRVLEIDTGSRTIVQVARSRAGHQRWNLDATVSDGSSILSTTFWKEKTGPALLKYNLENKRWYTLLTGDTALPTGFQWSDFYEYQDGHYLFNPGLNTFTSP